MRRSRRDDVADLVYRESCDRRWWILAPPSSRGGRIYVTKRTEEESSKKRRAPCIVAGYYANRVTVRMREEELELSLKVNETNIIFYFAIFLQYLHTYVYLVLYYFVNLRIKVCTSMYVSICLSICNYVYKTGKRGGWHLNRPGKRVFTLKKNERVSKLSPFVSYRLHVFIRLRRSTW